MHGVLPAPVLIEQCPVNMYSELNYNQPPLTLEHFPNSIETVSDTTSQQSSPPITPLTPIRFAEANFLESRYDLARMDDKEALDLVKKRIQSERTNNHLWTFLFDLLMDSSKSGVCSWEDDTGMFRIRDPLELAKLWGKQRNRATMTYETLSRSLRHYYEKKILHKVPKKKFTYKFNSKEIIKSYYHLLPLYSARSNRNAENNNKNSLIRLQSPPTQAKRRAQRQQRQTKKTKLAKPAKLELEPMQINNNLECMELSSPTIYPQGIQQDSPIDYSVNQFNQHQYQPCMSQENFHQAYFTPSPQSSVPNTPNSINNFTLPTKIEVEPQCVLQPQTENSEVNVTEILDTIEGWLNSQSPSLDFSQQNLMNSCSQMSQNLHADNHQMLNNQHHYVYQPSTESTYRDGKRFENLCDMNTTYDMPYLPTY